MKIKCKCGYTLTVVYETIPQLKQHLGRNHEFDDMDLALWEIIFRIQEKIEELEAKLKKYPNYDNEYDWSNKIDELKSLLENEK